MCCYSNKKRRKKSHLAATSFSGNYGETLSMFVRISGTDQSAEYNTVKKRPKNSAKKQISISMQPHEMIQENRVIIAKVCVLSLCLQL